MKIQKLEHTIVSPYLKKTQKKFEYKVEEGCKIEIHNAPSDAKEAAIVKAITERVLPSRSVLILLPHRGFSRAIVEELRKAGISYTAPLILPGEGLPLISTLSEWLRDSTHSLAFRDCLEAFINAPTSGIPSRRSRKRQKLARRENALFKISCLWKLVIERKVNGFWSALEREKENDDLYLNAFSVFDKIRSLNNSESSPADFIAEISQKFSLWKKPEKLLEEVDAWVETYKLMNDIGQGSSVQLMTLQGAKGLEADVVCVVGLQEGILPKEGASEKEIAEQSRLMFVSMTRAKEELHLFHARKRSGAIMFRPLYKKGEKPDIRPSRFIDTIPDEHKNVHYHK